MKATLPPYPAYKPTDIPWLQQVPENWSEMKVKYIFRERVQKGYPDEPLLAATQSMGVVTKETYGERTVTAQKDLHLLKLVEKGDFVISLRSFQGGIEISHARGIISPAYIILKVARQCHPHYLAYLLKSAPFIDGLKLFITGIREGQNIDYARLARTYLPWPEPDEQHLIVRYLRALDAKVKRYIRAKRSEVVLIKELLFQATERGMYDPSAKKVRIAVATERMMRSVQRVASDEYTRIGLYNRGRGIFHKPRVIGTHLGDSEFFWVDEGDLIISGQFAWEGAVALARQHDTGCIASHRYPIIRGKPEYLSTKVLLAILRTGYGTMLLDHHSRGAAGRNRPLNERTFLKEYIPIPSPSSQAEIIELLDKEYEVTQAVSRAVASMQEYHTRLVADVVTGAVDVRAAAQAMPADQMISGSDDQIMEDEPLSMAAEGEAEYGAED
jgi:type I restriction enzyme S subunit